VAEAGQEYARVTAMLGSGRVKAMFHDGSERLCRIRGSMRRREWVHVGETVLVAVRDELAGDVCDIVFRYQPQDLALLKKLGEPVIIAAGTEEERDLEDLVDFEAEAAMESRPAGAGAATGAAGTAEKHEASSSSGDESDWLRDI
jgi:translation initiation factor 1A